MPSLSREQDQFQASWLSQMPAEVTVLDAQGRILFYNDYAPKILDRQPGHLGLPVQELHQPSSAAKIEAILASYRQGGRQEYSWVLQRGERRFVIRVAPWLEEGRLKGLIHLGLVLPPAPPAG